VTKVAAWLAFRLDRFAGRWSQLADTVVVRWYRSTDRIAARRERFAEGVSVGWQRVRGRMMGGRRRPTEGAGERWFRFVDRIGARRERFVEMLSLHWYGLHDRLRHRWEMTLHPRDGWRGRRVADSAIALTLIGIICLTSAVTISTLVDTMGDGPPGLDLAGRDPDQGIDPAGESGAWASTEKQPSGSDPPDDQRDGFRVHSDEPAGYSFSYPAGWELSASGKGTRLIDSGGDVMISFSTAPGGSIQRLSERLVDSLADRYGEVEMVARDAGETPQGERSLVVGGRATDTDGSTIRFLVITIRGPDRNRAITVRFSADSDPLGVSPWIRQIVGSFKTSDVAPPT
jgi:hypothetical protein